MHIKLSGKKEQRQEMHGELRDNRRKAIKKQKKKDLVLNELLN